MVYTKGELEEVQQLRGTGFLNPFERGFVDIRCYSNFRYQAIRSCQYVVKWNWVGGMNNAFGRVVLQVCDSGFIFSSDNGDFFIGIPAVVQVI